MTWMIPIMMASNRLRSLGGAETMKFLVFYILLILPVSSVAGPQIADVPISHRAKTDVSAADATTSTERVAVTLPGGSPMAFVRISAGKFQMGSPPTEQDRESDEGPVHTVTIGYPFYLDKYEVTKAQWKAVMNTTPWSGQFAVTDDPDSPAVYVSWNDLEGAGGFIHKLNKYLSSSGQGKYRVRLPSEAEWEYACRAGTTTRFYWGDDLSGAKIGDYAWYVKNAWRADEKYAHPVGRKKPNPWGLYDMCGNIWEWCEDIYHPSYANAPSDGSAWVSPSTPNRVLRGGGWPYVAGRCRAAIRNCNNPSGRYNHMGFRLVLLVR